MLRWLWLSVGVVVLDQATKYLAEHFLRRYEALEVLPFFDLTLLYNTGAAFSFLSDAGGWQRWFFILLAAIVSVVIVFWLRRLRSTDLALAVALALILGGAVGNVVDRIVLGHVVDFISLHYRQWYWPAFNIADSAITVGVVILLLDGFLKRKQQV